MKSPAEKTATVTLTIGEWRHVVAGLKTAHDVLWEDKDRLGREEKVEQYCARFGDPLVLIPNIRDKIADSVGAETGETPYFADLIETA